MLRASTLVCFALLTYFALSTSACARSKSTEVTPDASSTTTPSSSMIVPAARAPKLCSDGVHHPGDHWKESCNPCRCAADGDVTCARFPCPAAPDASADGGARP